MGDALGGQKVPGSPGVPSLTLPDPGEGLALRVPGQESAFSQVGLRKSNCTHFLWEEKKNGFNSVSVAWSGP